MAIHQITVVADNQKAQWEVYWQEVAGGYYGEDYDENSLAPIN